MIQLPRAASVAVLILCLASNEAMLVQRGSAISGKTWEAHLNLNPSRLQMKELFPKFPECIIDSIATQQTSVEIALQDMVTLVLIKFTNC